MDKKKLVLFWAVFAALLLGTVGLYFSQVLHPANGIHFVVAPLFTWYGVAHCGDFFPSLSSRPLSEGSRVLMGISFLLLGGIELLAAYNLWLFATPLVFFELILLLWARQRERKE